MSVVGKKEEIQPGQARAVYVDGRRIAVFNVGGSFYAIDDTCTHRGGPLSEGEINGLEVTCPWHGAVFDLCTGKARDEGPYMKGAPETACVRCYQVEVEGSDLKIEL
ncbi:MAG: non-heme iron oxygenase ferredoxin subunit [Acidobacteria bacterium]|nr:non-heme iron oxygenase ferredoxin subunit [Acidobacteriota bacterium]